MSHNGARFGHRVWCSVIVTGQDMEDLSVAPVTNLEVQKQEGLQWEECHLEEMVVTEDCNAAVVIEDDVVVKETAVRLESDPAILTAQDILSFEMLDIRDRSTPKVSQTATPTNTPMGENITYMVNSTFMGEDGGIMPGFPCSFPTECSNN